MELVRTGENLTAGITNIPLTKPAFIYFRTDLTNPDINMIYSVFESYKIPFRRSDNMYNQTAFFTTTELIDSKMIKQIFRNFRTLRPKLLTDYRYLFWEIDTREDSVLQNVVDVYAYLELPVYIYKSMRGFHFMSVYPIKKAVFQWAIKQLRHTNDGYPPITLRIKPNKYVNEEMVFKEGWIISNRYHTDTQQLMKMILAQDFNRLGELYQVVWYNIDKKKEIEA